MAKFMDLYTELPAIELAAKVERGIGSFKFTISEPTALGPRFVWEHGSVSVIALNNEQKELAREDCRVRNPISHLYFHPRPEYEGSLDVYQMTATALNDWEGDLALVNWGETVEVERVDGKVTLNRSSIPAEALTLMNYMVRHKT